MKLTATEQAEIKAFLWEEVKYQETFDEVYDHVITALEYTGTSSSPLLAQVKAVITDEFGGFSEMRDLEKQRLCIEQSAVLKKYFRQLSVLNFRSVALIILAAMVFAKWPSSLAAAVLIISSVLFALLPVVLVGFKGLKSLFNYRSRKPSFKDAMLFKLGFFSYLAYKIIGDLGNYFYKSHSLKIIGQNHPWLVIVMVVVYFTMGLSFVNTYRNSYRVKVVSNN